MPTRLTWPGLDDPATNQFVTILLTGVIVTWALISVIRTFRK